jgi:hypothetical protein
MKVEYLAYRLLLLSQVAEKAAEPQVEVEKRKAYLELDCNSQAESPPQEIQMHPSWFPQNCLVFVLYTQIRIKPLYGRCSAPR